MPAHRKPTEVLELSGAFQHNPARRRPVGPKSSEPVGPPPVHLAADEAECWYEFTRDAPAGVLTGGDRFALEVLCRLVAKSRRQWLSGAEWANLRAFLGELGASPAARSRVAPAAPEPPAESALDRFAAMRQAVG
jgi:hypothetical protein